MKWVGIAKEKLQAIAEDATRTEGARQQARQDLEQLDRFEVALTLGQVNLTITPESK